MLFLLSQKYNAYNAVHLLIEGTEAAARTTFIT